MMEAFARLLLMIIRLKFRVNAIPEALRRLMEQKEAYQLSKAPTGNGSRKRETISRRKMVAQANTRSLNRLRIEQPPAIRPRPVKRSHRTAGIHTERLGSDKWI